MTELLDAIRSALEAQGRCLLVTIAQIKGSTPRESGAKLVVWEGGFVGSIGGGQLEYAALTEAERRLAEAEPGGPHVERVALGPSLGQCCGGSATLLMETIDESAKAWLEPLADAMAAERPAALVSAMDGPLVAKSLVEPRESRGAILPEPVAEAALRLLELAEASCRIEKDRDGLRYLIEPPPPSLPSLLLFGAGHVGQALAPLLAGLPFRTRWIDERPAIFPEDPPSGLTLAPSPVPALLVDEAPASSYYLVMTHSHARDLEICERVLQRGDFAYLGLIGSATKRARFERRFRDLGLGESRIAGLTCPIGVEGISGKSPAEIAVAVAAQLLQQRELAAATDEPMERAVAISPRVAHSEDVSG